MTSAKQQHLERIRSETAYPTFRSLINFFAISLCILGGIFLSIGVLGLVGQLLGLWQSFGLLPGLGLVVAGVIYIITGKVFKEAAVMLADMVDSLTDLNSRYEQQ